MTYDEQCDIDSTVIDQTVVEAISSGSLVAVLAVSGLQMNMNPNLWTMINTLQILRTILLLKINLPVSVRSTIASSSLFSGFDFGITSRIFPNYSANDDIIDIMNGDTVLASNYEEYGISTYRFLDFVISVFFDCITIFVFFSVLSAIWVAIYMKVKKRPVKPAISKHFKSIYVYNGFVRLYLEILLDGIIYMFLNMRSKMLMSLTLDATSYFFMAIYFILVV